MWTHKHCIFFSNKTNDFSQFMDMLTTQFVAVVAVDFWSSPNSSALQKKTALEEWEEASFSVSDKCLLSKGCEVETFKFIALR